MTNQPVIGLRPIDEALLEALRADQRRHWIALDEVTSWRPGLRSRKQWLAELMAALTGRSTAQAAASAKKLVDAGLLERDPHYRLYQLSRAGLPDPWPHPLEAP